MQRVKEGAGSNRFHYLLMEMGGWKLPVAECELSLGLFSSTCVFNVADTFNKKLRPGV